MSTSQSGVLAAGDVWGGEHRAGASAAGVGTAAALGILRHVEGLPRRLRPTTEV